MIDKSDRDDELATPEDRARLEGLIDGLGSAHAIAKLHGDDANAERIAEMIRAGGRLVTRMRRQHGVEPETLILQ